jgi:glycosyltransferase involved in cell wall biosynthesis
LVLSSWYPTELHPYLGNFVENQANLMSKEYQVTFLRLLPLGEKIPTPTTAVDFQYVTIFYKHSSWWLLNYFAKKKAIQHALKNLPKVDLIHAHVLHPNGWQFRLAKKLLKCPLVVTEHASYFASNFIWSKRMQWNIHKTVQQTDILIAVSTFLAQAIEKRLNVLPHQIIGNPVDLNAFSNIPKLDDTIQFLHISTLSAVKNVAPILEAFKQVLKNYPNAQLTIVSDEDSMVVQQFAKQLGIQNSVVFAGPTEHSKMATYYQQASCFVLNSHFETFSIVVAEAWACGIPVISTPVGIACEPSEGALIHTDGTSKSIAHAMLQFIENKETYDVSNIRSKVTPFASETIFNQLKKVYKRLIG